MQDLSYKLIAEGLSPERLSSYAQDGVDQEAALARYLWNIALSESLYASLHFCEVSLRNTLHSFLSQQYGEEWYDSSQLTLTDWGVREVQSAQSKLIRAKKPPTPHNTIAELNFGFWTHLFQGDYHSPQGFLPNHIKSIFPFLEKSRHKPKEIKRSLDAIRNLRNRIFHHERIIHWKDLQHKHCLLYTSPSPRDA